MGRPGAKRDRLRLAGPPATEWCPPLPHAALSDAALPSADAPADPSPEAAYARRTSAAHRRRYGQFFTPPAVAELMCDWVDAVAPRRVLDPAAGPGIFVRAMLARRPAARITAIDVDPAVLAALAAAVGRRGNVEILQADFLRWPCDAPFDAVLANPPYLRHHDLLYDEDIHAAVGAQSGVRLSRLTNAYCLFVLEICRRLRPGGRAAVIVPGEWLNANFGAPIKRLLLERRLLRRLIYFSHAQRIFADALTTASLLLIERPPSASVRTGDANGGAAEGTAGGVAGGTLPTAFVRGDDCLADLRRFAAGEAASHRDVLERRLPVDLLLQTPKWNALLEHGPAPAGRGLVRLGELAATRRGIATGANAFFHVAPAVLRQYRIRPRQALPCVGRAADVAGLVFSADDFDRLAERNRRTWLLAFSGTLAAGERRYLDEGAAAGLPARYLLAQRNPWYAMESRPPAPVWAAVFGRRELRFVWNRAGAYHLTTFHGVYPHDPRPEFAAALVGCLVSGPVQRRAAAHQRVYGGGLIKFEPRDLLEIEVPDLRQARPAALCALQAALLRLDAARRSGNPAAESRLRRALDAHVQRLIDGA